MRSIPVQADLFALLDVSTNADLFESVSIPDRVTGNYRYRCHNRRNHIQLFPVQVDGMDVVSAGVNVKAFTYTDIMEPVFNLSLRLL